MQSGMWRTRFSLSSWRDAGQCECIGDLYVVAAVGSSCESPIAGYYGSFEEGRGRHFACDGSVSCLFCFVQATFCKLQGL
jgi:hypothetical protein